MVLLEYLATYKRHVVETVLKLRVQSTDSYRSSSLCSWEGVWRLGGRGAGQSREDGGWLWCGGVGVWGVGGCVGGGGGVGSRWDEGVWEPVVKGG